MIVPESDTPARQSSKKSKLYGWKLVIRNLTDHAAELGPYSHSVAVALIDHVDSDGQCYPSIKRIMARTGIGSDHTVKRAIAKLISSGIMTVLETQKGFIRKPVYRFVGWTETNSTIAPHATVREPITTQPDDSTIALLAFSPSQPDSSTIALLPFSPSHPVRPKLNQEVKPGSKAREEQVQGQRGADETCSSPVASSKKSDESTCALHAFESESKPEKQKPTAKRKGESSRHKQLVAMCAASWIRIHEALDLPVPPFGFSDRDGKAVREFLKLYPDTPVTEFESWFKNREASEEINPSEMPHRYLGKLTLYASGRLTRFKTLDPFAAVQRDLEDQAARESAEKIEEGKKLESQIADMWERLRDGFPYQPDLRAKFARWARENRPAEWRVWFDAQPKPGPDVKFEGQTMSESAAQAILDQREADQAREHAETSPEPKSTSADPRPTPRPHGKTLAARFDQGTKTKQRVDRSRRVLLKAAIDRGLIAVDRDGGNSAGFESSRSIAERILV